MDAKNPEPINEFRIAEKLVEWFADALRFSNDRGCWFANDGNFWRPCSGDVSLQILGAVQEKLGPGVTLRALRAAMGMLKAHKSVAAKMDDLRRDVEGLRCILTSEPRAAVSRKGRAYAAAEAECADGKPVSLLVFEEGLRLDLLRLGMGDTIEASGEGRPGFVGFDTPTLECSGLRVIEHYKPEPAIEDADEEAAELAPQKGRRRALSARAA